MNLEHALTKESVGGSISVFMFHLLLPRLLRLLADVDGQPRAYHAVNGIHMEGNNKMFMNVSSLSWFNNNNR